MIYGLSCDIGFSNRAAKLINSTSGAKSGKVAAMETKSAGSDERVFGLARIWRGPYPAPGFGGRSTDPIL